MELTRLAAELTLGGLRAEEAVRLGVALVADRVDGVVVVTLASLPEDAKQLRAPDVAHLFREVLTDVALEPPTEWEAGWIEAAFIARAVIDQRIAPADGAFSLWELWDVCGEPDDELTWMLQLHDAWEQTPNSQRAPIEAEIRAYAPRIIAAARQKILTDAYDLPLVEPSTEM